MSILESITLQIVEVAAIIASFALLEKQLTSAVKAGRILLAEIWRSKKILAGKKCLMMHRNNWRSHSLRWREQRNGS